MYLKRSREVKLLSTLGENAMRTTADECGGIILITVRGLCATVVTSW